MTRRNLLFCYSGRLLLFVLLIVTMISLTAGCGSKNDQPDAYQDSQSFDSSRVENDEGSSLPLGSTFVNIQGDTAKKIIYHGEATLYVTNFEEAVRLVEEETHRLEGYIADNNIHYDKDGINSGSWMLRIPVNYFREFMDFFNELGRVENERTYSNDVSQQYIDLESQIKSLGAEEDRLIEILDMAENVSEVLEVERELSRVRQEKESLQTQFNYLHQQVIYSTVQLEMLEEAGQEQVTGGGLTNLGTRISREFKGSVDFVLSLAGSLLVGIIGGLPIILLSAAAIAVLYYCVRLYKNYRSGTKL